MHLSNYETIHPWRRKSRAGTLTELREFLVCRVPSHPFVALHFVEIFFANLVRNDWPPYDHELVSLVGCPVASLRGKRVAHISTPTTLNSAGARGQHRCSTRLCGWTKFNNKGRNKVMLVRHSRGTFPSPYVGDMFRFT